MGSSKTSVGDDSSAPCQRTFLLAFPIALLALVLAADVANAQSTPLATQSAYLKPHNAARRQVSVPALTWNATLASYALKYAKSQTNRCLPLTHSKGPYGENLFWGSGKVWTPQDAVYYWVKEKADYTRATNKCKSGKVCGHYTQVVWRSTKSVGCASVACKDGSTYFICSYYPFGNIIGQAPY